MKYFKLYENFNSNSTNIRVFRGTDEAEFMKIENSEESGYFFSTSLDFAEDYGDYIIEGQLNCDNIFISYEDKYIKKLYDAGFQLTDNFLTENNDSGTHPTYDFENNYYPTYEDYIIAPHTGSDTWQMIEESDGVMNYIMYHYGVVLIMEGGVVNFYVDQPNKFITIENIYKR